MTKLRKITQVELDAIPRDNDGVKVCPAFTDYSDIKSFGKRRRFQSEEKCRQAIIDKYGEGHMYLKALDLLKMMEVTA